MQLFSYRHFGAHYANRWPGNLCDGVGYKIIVSTTEHQRVGTQRQQGAVGAVRRTDASVGAWQQGSIIAINRPLGELLAELSRYRPGVVRCDPAIAQLKVSGAFPIDDTDRALAALESGFSLRIERYTRYWVRVSQRRLG